MSSQLGSAAEQLAAMSDDELRSIVKGEHRPGPWGTSGDAEVGGTKVFLKRVPITAVEASRPRSTRNHFKLPTYYSYGVGSAGFGVWRELAVHELTARGGQYPALLHHRVMERRGASGPNGALSALDVGGMSLDEYVTYWNGSASVRSFMQARTAAPSELWIVLEHIPNPALVWLMMNQARAGDLLGAVFGAIAELNSRGVIHFDAHLFNVVTDGERFALTDFGLAMSSDFDLTAREREFMARHCHYDYGLTLGHLGLALAAAIEAPPGGRAIAHAIDHVDELPVTYAPELVAAFRRYRDPMVHMVDFITRMRRPGKRARYDDAAMRDALVRARVPIA